MVLQQVKCIWMTRGREWVRCPIERFLRQTSSWSRSTTWITDTTLTRWAWTVQKAWRPAFPPAHRTTSQGETKTVMKIRISLFWPFKSYVFAFSFLAFRCYRYLLETNTPLPALLLPKITNTIPQNRSVHSNSHFKCNFIK